MKNIKETHTEKAFNIVIKRLNRLKKKYLYNFKVLQCIVFSMMLCKIR